MNPVRTALILASLAASLSAQAPATATALCKDGTYSTIATKATACHGHKGIHTWLATPTAPSLPAPTPAASIPSIAPPTPVPELTSAPRPTNIATERTKLLSAPQAPGAAPNLVWLNTANKVYHCPTSQFYGKTKSGQYLPESEAKAQGAHPAHNKPCS